ncbi:hypothetical protein GCM10027423_64280 [Spirosoma arcticum]
MPEPTHVGEGGDFEAKPKRVDNVFFGLTNDGQNSLKAPMIAGAYHLYIYAMDSHNNVSTANLPFYVNE